MTKKVVTEVVWYPVHGGTEFGAEEVTREIDVPEPKKDGCFKTILIVAAIGLATLLGPSHVECASRTCRVISRTPAEEYRTFFGQRRVRCQVSIHCSDGSSYLRTAYGNQCK
jgi:hypothetical protein